MAAIQGVISRMLSTITTAEKAVSLFSLSLSSLSLSVTHTSAITNISGLQSGQDLGNDSH